MLISILKCDVNVTYVYVKVLACDVRSREGSLIRYPQFKASHVNKSHLALNLALMIN